MSSELSAEKKQELQVHVQAMAKILFDASNKEELKTLRDIEVTLRQHLQEHVSPEMGLFLLQALQERQKAIPEP
jgi:hypothetical protein